MLFALSTGQSVFFLYASENIPPEIPWICSGARTQHPEPMHDLPRFGMHSVRPFFVPFALLFLLVSFGFPARNAAAQTAQRAAPRAEPDAYWIFLDGKPDAARAEISERARERRARRGQPQAAEMDRNVSPTYLRALEEAGAEIRTESRWLNAVSARLTEEMLFRLREMDFVREIRPVAQGKHRLPEPVSDAPPSPFSAKTGNDLYGPSRTQLELMNAIEPLERGINGKGVRIGFLDTPFGNFDHTAFDVLKKENRLLAVRNFTGRTDDNNIHGMNVASTAAGYQEGALIGPAHGAEVLAAVTEYAPTETNREEDNFVAGLEWMESEGVDVVNISLGYSEFDRGQRSYAVSDMDGDTGITTIAADKAAALGVVVVTSAGNEGRCSSPQFCWYYVTTPADADSVITVGAVDARSNVASFSSRGPTADGRRKPDVAALGVFAYVGDRGNLFKYSNGTSFSAPLVTGVVAQVLQANPDLAPMAVRDILRQTAHQADKPDNVLGWGVVNAGEAVRMAESMAGGLVSAASDEAPTETALLGNYPNPFNPETTIRYTLEQAGRVRLAAYDLLGREIATLVDGQQAAGEHRIRFEAGALPAGAYVYRLQTPDKVAARTMLLVK